MVLVDSLTSYIYRNTEAPSLFWRSGSYATLLFIHGLCRGALVGFNKLHVHGLERFSDLLKSRTDYRTRTKGLVTVSNHISVLDDPVIWGALPMSFAVAQSHQNHRWSFGSHDLCFTNAPLSHFFSLGQVLPTHRIQHSVHGGLFQPTFTEAVRMLSRIDSAAYSYNPLYAMSPGTTGGFNPSSPTSSVAKWPRSAIDPLSPVKTPNGEYAPGYPSCPNDVRLYNAPSRYACNSYSWLHIFPEGCIHQTAENERYMRYFKWGVSRLILEPPVAPDFVPMFIEGTDQMMHESRTFPRFIPRFGKEIHVTFGSEVNVEVRFGDLRKKWRTLCDEENEKWLASMTADELALIVGAAPTSNLDKFKHEHKEILLDSLYDMNLGLVAENLKYRPDVVELRKECTMRVREEVLKLRRARGYPDEDPKASVAATWKLEGPKREGQMEDESWIKDT